MSAQSPDSNAAPQDLVRVHGIVLNAVTHAPIQRALVTSVDQRMAVMTDDKGRFGFDVNVAAGSDLTSALHGMYQSQPPYIVVKKPGYLAPALPVLLPIDNLAALKAELQVQMMPEGSISGSAVGATEEVPTGLNVQLLHRQLQDGLSAWMQVQTQQADARGRFHFGGLMPGDYKIVTAEWVDQIGPMGGSTSKPVAGYPPQFYPSGSSLAFAAVFHLGGGRSAVADLNLRGAKYYQVEVPITSNSPVKFVQVQVASENGPGYTLGFNPKSQKVEGMLPDGIYHLTVVELGQAGTPGGAPDIRVGTGNLIVAGKPAQGAGIALLAAATVAVNVREDFTGPDPNAAGTEAAVHAPVAGDAGPPVRLPPVEAFLGPAAPGFEANMSSLGFNAMMQADPNTGDLSFSGVIPGKYRIRITPRRGYVASATANGIDLLRDPLLVQSGAEPSAISIILRDDSGTITGSVSGPAARSNQAFGNYVMAIPMGDEPAAQPYLGTSQGDGKFTLSNVVPGRYLVVAGEGLPPAFEYRNKEAMRSHESQGVVVDLSAGQTVTISLKALLRDPGYGGEVDD